MRSAAKVIFSCTFAVFVTGCTATSTPPPVSYQRPSLNLASPEPPKLTAPTVVVVTEQNARAVFAKLKAEGKRPVLFGYDSDQHATLLLNVGKLTQFITGQRVVIEKYKEYYEQQPIDSVDVRGRDTKR